MTTLISVPANENWMVTLKQTNGISAFPGTVYAVTKQGQYGDTQIGEYTKLASTRPEFEVTVALAGGPTGRNYTLAADAGATQIRLTGPEGQQERFQDWLRAV